MCRTTSVYLGLAGLIGLATGLLWECPGSRAVASEPGVAVASETRGSRTSQTSGIRKRGGSFQWTGARGGKWGTRLLRQSAVRRPASTPPRGPDDGLPSLLRDVASG